MEYQEIVIPIGDSQIKGNLTLVPDTTSLVIFAHGSGSSRLSKRNQFVADIFHGWCCFCFVGCCCGDFIHKNGGFLPCAFCFVGLGNTWPVL